MLFTLMRRPIHWARMAFASVVLASVALALSPVAIEAASEGPGNARAWAISNAASPAASQVTLYYFWGDG